MKWNNKGHEFDSYYETICNGINLDYGVYCFGAGKIGADVFSIIKSFCNVEGFIDNDVTKIGGHYEGKPVVSIKEKRISGHFILVTVENEHYGEIKEQLRDDGYIEGKDFSYWETFFEKMFPVVLNYQKGKTYVGLTQISVTERCTLKCSNCAHACNYVSITDNDLSIESIKRSADYFFSICDYVNTFVVIGGEPLLYKDLAEVIDYIGEKYRNRMHRFQISTNGTITPSEEIIEKSCKWNVYYLISNYCAQIPKLRAQYDKLLSKLDSSGIKYALFPEDVEWTDYGFKYVEREYNPQMLTRVFDLCHTECHEIRENKFYYCVMARSVNDNMKRGVGIDDYLDIGAMNPDSQIDKRIFMEYTLGYSDKGFLDMCRFCNGSERSRYIIPAAVQDVRNK